MDSLLPLEYPTLSAIVVILAAWRLTRLVTADTFPPIKAVRDKITAKYPEDIHPIGDLVTCIWCAGFWVSTATVLFAALVPIAYWVLTPFAVSGLVGLINKLENS